MNNHAPQGVAASAHVVVIENVFVCHHCGARYPITLPAPINVYIAACNAFVKDHAACPPPEPTKP